METQSQGERIQVQLILNDTERAFKKVTVSSEMTCDQLLSQFSTSLKGGDDHSAVVLILLAKVTQLPLNYIHYDHDLSGSELPNYSSRNINITKANTTGSNSGGDPNASTAVSNSSSKNQQYSYVTLSEVTESSPSTCLTYVHSFQNKEDKIIASRNRIVQHLEQLRSDAWEDYNSYVLVDGDSGEAIITDNDDNYSKIASIKRLPVQLQWLVVMDSMYNNNLSDNVAEPEFYMIPGDLSGDESSDCDGTGDDVLCNTPISSIDIHQEVSLSEEYRKNLLSCKKSSCITLKEGSLMKQSRKDPFVWRRVWVTLADDELWFSSRCRYTQKRKGLKSFAWAAKHRVVHLLRVKMEKHRRYPNSFSLTTSAGMKYVLRAKDSDEESSWMKTISSLIDVSNDSHLVEMADMMIKDEETARAKRFNEAVKDTFHTRAENDNNDLYSSLNKQPRLLSVSENKVIANENNITYAALMRFQIRVHEFQEARRLRINISSTIGSRQWALNRCSTAKLLDAAIACASSSIFREASKSNPQLKILRKAIVSDLIDKQRVLNMTDQDIEPPVDGLFDPVLAILKGQMRRY